MKILKDIRVIETGHLYHGAGRGDAPRRPRRGCDQGGTPGHGRPVPRLQGRALFAALPDLQPQQALHRARHGDCPTIWRCSTTLIAGADVFIQNFRPGVAEKLGAGEEELRRINPRLVYCAISGFGTTGPSRDRPAYDTVAQAASGFLRLLTPPTNPRVIGPAIADAVTGQYAAMGILAALLEREKDRQGPPHRHLDAGGHVPLQPRQLHPLLQRGRGDGPALPPRGLAELHLRMRGREMGRDPHVLARRSSGKASSRPPGRRRWRRTRASPNGWSGSGIRTR